MSVSEEAAAAFLKIHNRLKSLEETVQGSEGSGTRGVLTRMALIKQLVNTSGALGEGRETRRSKIAGSKGCSDITIFGGEYEDYEDWQHKVRIFLNSECFVFTRFSTIMESLDREIDLEDIHGGQIRCFTKLFGMVLVVLWFLHTCFVRPLLSSSGDLSSCLLHSNFEGLPSGERPAFPSIRRIASVQLILPLPAQRCLVCPF